MRNRAKGARPAVSAHAAPSSPRDDLRPQETPAFEVAREHIAGRIRTAIGHTNIAELARALAVSRSAVYDWMKGANLPGLEKIALLGTLTDTSLVWLITGHGPRRSDLLPSGGYVLPEIEVARSPSPLAFNRAWLSGLLADFYAPGERDAGRWIEGSRPYLFCVRDDAMTPTLAVGDWVLVNAVGVVVPGGDERLPRNGVYLFKGDQLRRVEWQFDGSAVISADNKFYGAEPRKLAASELPFVIGPAIWHGRRI